MQFWLLTLLFLVILYACQKVLSFWQAVKTIQNHPGYRTLLSLTAVISNILPPLRGITPGSNNLFLNKHKYFELYGWDVLSAISILPNTDNSLLVADAEAIKEITSSRARFPKPVDQYRVLTFFGQNIVASEFDEWKRYRKISAPAFSDRNNKMVWEETVRIMNDLFMDEWADKKVIEVNHCVDITLPIALFVISAAGFGRKISWDSDAILPPNHTMTFKDALHVVTSEIFLKLIVPDWAFGLTKRLQTVRLAFKELHDYMSEMIQERQTSEKQERHDLFSSLLEANNDDLVDMKLSESELIGNIFIFLVAGHETTAHTLCFSFAMLALYEDEQEILYQHIKSVLPDDRIPNYEEMPLLTHSMAVFYETLRMFPPLNAIPKYSAEDTSLQIGNIKGEKKTIPVPKGTNIIISTPGLHYNPRYWEDPESFKPSRFLKSDWPRDAFLPFSAGARACIGRKFFETEGIAILTMLVSKYKITVMQEAQFANETFEEKKARVLSSKPGLTITPIRVPLVFTRR